MGFRKFEMKNNRMLINGKRVVFKGVNRHEFSAATGRACSYAEIEQDIQTMKQNNINAVRTSHYQNQDALYDLCDRYGLYMMPRTTRKPTAPGMPMARASGERISSCPTTAPSGKRC